MTKTEDSTRVYDKKQACYYCEKIVAKIARHYMTVHKDKAEVCKALSYPKKSSERQRELERLRLRGNYHHNIKVIETKKGPFIPVRRPTENENLNVSDFLPCPSCLGFFKRIDLWKHNKTCNFRNSKVRNDDDENEEAGYRKIQQESRILLLSQLKSDESKAFLTLKSIMRSDEITVVARTDWLISKFGQTQLERVGQERSREASQSMRELARLLLELQKVTKKDDELKKFLTPENFDEVVAAVRSLCRFEEKATRKTVGIPSLALKLGYSLKKCLYILKGQALRNKLSTQNQEYFLQLMEAEWNSSVSYHSLGELARKKFNKIELLPLTSDLKQLRTHLMENMGRLTEMLKKEPSLQLWVQLAEYTVTRCVIFNKRRGGEATKLLVKNYKERPNWSEAATGDVFGNLQPVEKVLCER